MLREECSLCAQDVATLPAIPHARESREHPFAFGVSRRHPGPVSYVVFALAGLGTLVALAGILTLLATAFTESIAWGFACLLVPGASLVFVATHWEETKKAFGMWLGGMALAAFSVLVVGPKWNDAKRALADSPQTVSIPMGKGGKPACVAAPPSDGFATWCCTAEGWTMIDQTGCSTVYHPSEACDAQAFGRVSSAVCGTIGPKIKKKDDDMVEIQKQMNAH